MIAYIDIVKEKREQKKVFKVDGCLYKMGFPLSHIRLASYLVCVLVPETDTLQLKIQLHS